MAPRSETSSVAWRSGRARLDDVARSDGHLLAARPGEEPVRGEDLVDLPVEPDASLGEDHDVVAHALELGDDVRREDDGEPRLGNRLHQRTEEVPARERVERGDRLVEQGAPAAASRARGSTPPEPAARPRAFRPSARGGGRGTRAASARSRRPTPGSACGRTSSARRDGSRGRADGPVRRSRRAEARSWARVAPTARARALPRSSACRGRSRAAEGSSCRRRSGRRALSPLRTGSRASNRGAPTSTRTACRALRSRRRAGRSCRLLREGGAQGVLRRAPRCSPRRALPCAPSSSQSSSARRSASDLVGGRRP